jgi:hypothetical protein
MNLTPKQIFKLAFAAAAGMASFSFLASLVKMVIFLIIRGMGGF